MNTPMTFPSPKIRRTAYLLYTVIALISGALQVAYSSGGWGQPVWLTVGVAVLAFLGGALGGRHPHKHRADDVGAMTGRRLPI